MSFLPLGPSGCSGSCDLFAINLKRLWCMLAIQIRLISPNLLDFDEDWKVEIDALIRPCWRICIYTTSVFDCRNHHNM